MATISKARAGKLISQLQQIQQREVQILQELYSIQGNRQAQGEDSSVGESYFYTRVM